MPRAATPSYISPPLYKKIIQAMPIPCVDLLIYRGDSFLLLKRTNEPAKGLWFVPGGRIHKNETIIHAARRKAIQELGMELIIDRVLGTYEVFFKTGPFGDEVHNIVITILARIKGNPKIKIDSQHTQYTFVNHASPDLHPYLVQILRDARMIDSKRKIHAPK